MWQRAQGNRFDQRTRALAIAGLVISFIAGWSYLVATVGAKDIVAFIGVERGYLFAFLFALTGGISSFTSVSFFIAIATLAAGGLNPLLLASISGLGMTVGDVLFYYFGFKGREALEGRLARWVAKAAEWIHARHSWTLPGLIYIYCSFTFLPNDLLAVALALVRYPFAYAMVPIFLGNVTLLLMITYVAQHGLPGFGN